jgi:hypothetical protein
MIDHGVDLDSLSLEELTSLKEKYEAQREIYCQEYLVYANNCVRDMEIPYKRDHWDAKIKELEGPTQKYKHLIMDVIRQLNGLERGDGNVEVGSPLPK